MITKASGRDRNVAFDLMALTSLRPELLERSFDIDIQCSKCGGPVRLKAFLTRPQSLRRPLTTLGQPTDAPQRAPPRPPPYVTAQPRGHRQQRPRAESPRRALRRAWLSTWTRLKHTPSLVCQWLNGWGYVVVRLFLSPEMRSAAPAALRPPLVGHFTPRVHEQHSCALRLDEVWGFVTPR